MQTKNAGNFMAGWNAEWRGNLLTRQSLEVCTSTRCPQMPESGRKGREVEFGVRVVEVKFAEKVVEERDAVD